MTRRVHIVPGFDSPTLPAMRMTEFHAVLREHDLEPVAWMGTQALFADDAILVDGAVNPGTALGLPRERTVVLCGEPPQPDYLLPCYTAGGFEALISPLTGIYADEFAFYEPPASEGWPPRRDLETSRRMVQLTTYRATPGPLRVPHNGHPYTVSVLCALRAEVGLRIRGAAPDFLDIYGHGWPTGASRACTRFEPDFLARRTRISTRYAFDLCWENTAIPNYVSEKFWSPVRAGTLPVYFGPFNFNPPGVVNCLEYHTASAFDWRRLWLDLQTMPASEYYDRMHALLTWYYALPHDAHEQSWRKAAHHIARVLAA